MGAFLGVSIWFALVTVLPGLVAIAVAWGGVVVAAGGLSDSLVQSGFGEVNATLTIAGAVAVMIVIQSLGILLEEKLLVPRRLLGSRKAPREKALGSDVDPFALSRDGVVKMDPYNEYEGLYILLAELRSEDDVHGHLERAVTQFFLTINTFVAFAVGIAVTSLAWALDDAARSLVPGMYVGVLIAALVVIWFVAASRFELMGWTLWAARRRLARDHGDGRSDEGQ